MAIIYGTNTANWLVGGSASDQIFGWLISNPIGQEGLFIDSDDLEGGAGNDILSGGNGNDQLRGDSGNDICYGGAGDDTIIPGALFELPDGGKDTLYGGSGHDWISGGVGKDRLFGGAGDDYLDGRRGGNYLDGGDGNDTIYHYVGFGPDTAYGGTGIDRLRLSMEDTTAGVIFSLFNPAAMQTLSDGTVISGFERLDFIGGTGNDSVTGADLDDKLIGGGGNDRIAGGLGDDVLDGSEGNDAVFGGGGNDEIHGGLGNDRLFGDAGNDFLSVDFYEGIENVDGGAGIDQLYLGRFNSTLSLTLSIALPSIVQILSDGTRVVNIEQLDFLGGAGSDKVTGGNLVDNLFGGNGNDQLNGGSGNDGLYGGIGNDRLDGGLGIDTMDGGAGNDVYFVDNGLDRVSDLGTGPFSLDTVFSSISIGLSGFQITGTVENLVLTGTSVRGIGTAAANAITGNASANSLTGGSGQDRFVFRTALGTVDTITDFNVTDDSLLLDDAIFTSLHLGTLTLAEFHIGTGAADLSDRIIYNSATGALIYDANGSGIGQATQIAILSVGLALTAADVLVI